MHPFARRPQSYLAAQDFADAQGVIQVLHQLMDVPLARAESIALDQQQMAYAGELLEEIRSFRPQGAAQLDAALPVLIQHAVATKHVGLLLCMKDCTTNHDLQQEIDGAVQEILEQLPKPTDALSANLFHDNVDYIRKKIAQPPLAAINEMDELAQQYETIRDDVRASARAENDFIYVGRLAMRAHRLHRLAALQSATSDEPDAFLAQQLQHQGNSTIALSLLGWTFARPGQENALYATAEAIDAENDAKLLAMLNPPAKPKPEKEPAATEISAEAADVAWLSTKYIRPSAYQPLSEMTNMTMLRQLRRLAGRGHPSVIDQVRMGELLFGLQEMRGDGGQRLLNNEQGSLKAIAIKHRNILFLHALGQATTPPNECLSTLPELNTLMGDATRHIDPEFLAGQWYPKQTLQECDATLSKLVEDAEEWQASLLGMSLARHEFLRELGLDEAVDHSYEELTDLAADQDNLFGMTAMGYARTKPGQVLVNAKELYDKEAMLDGASTLSDEFANLMNKAAEIGLTADNDEAPKNEAPQTPEDAQKWMQRYLKAIQNKENGGRGRFLQN